MDLRPPPKLEPLFLICSERSGSNLLRVMVGAHPEIFAPPSLHIGRHIGRHFHAVGPARQDNPRWELTLQEIDKRLERHFDRAEADRVIDRLRATRIDGFGDVLATVFATLLEKHPGKHMVFIKENHIHEQVFFLLHYFPDAKFVFQVRDPRDYFASVVSMREGWLANKYGSTRYALQVWRDDQLGGLAALGHLGPERVFLQRYEDLVSEPERVLSELCRFLGVSFSSQMLDFHTDESVERMAQKRDAWANLSKPVISDNFKKYRTKLKPGVVRMIETYVGDVMTIFGYERDYPKTRSSRFWPTFWPQFLEPFERIANKDRQPFYSAGGATFISNLRHAAGVAEFPYNRTSESD